MKNLVPLFESLEKGMSNKDIPGVKVYEKSYVQHHDVTLLMVKEGSVKWILAAGTGCLYDELKGTEVQEKRKVCPQIHDNRLVLNRYFDYTIPQAFGPETTTIGLGDRLGLASPGHIQTVRNKTIKPILAQQSIRELTLTGRSMDDILDAASFAVFQEGYKDGFGADGDHLKEEADIQSALRNGVSMLTLDCSDYIYKDVEIADPEWIRTQYKKMSQFVQDRYNEQYLNKTFEIDGFSLFFDEISLMKNVLLYREAITYIVHIYNKYISTEKRDVDFEISIDETDTTTSPKDHFFVANELQQEGVRTTSLAPKFYGEFQKGIDYIGDIEQFEDELKVHTLIADHFGYKLSIYSGSDKFKVFSLISQYTQGRFHIKTAGTNWLEAIRVIAENNPDLYRQMHRYAMDHFEEARQYYEVTPDLEEMKLLDSVDDEELPYYMDNDASRQLFHVTYGLLLAAKDEKGRYLFKNKFFSTLNEHEDRYREALVHHIGNHLEELGL